MASTISPNPSNPYVPCGVNGRWVLSQYGHLAVLDEEIIISPLRKWLIFITVAIGIIHIVVIILLYGYYRAQRPQQSDTKEKFDNAAFALMIANAIGRYFHFIDNHWRPATYHDGDIIYCGLFIGDTDAFIPFQLIHVAIGLYGANALFRDQYIKDNTFHALTLWSLISSIGYLHFLVEPVTWFGPVQILSVLAEAFPAHALSWWAVSESKKWCIASTDSSRNLITSRSNDVNDSIELEPLVSSTDNTATTTTLELGGAPVRRRSKQREESSIA